MNKALPGLLISAAGAAIGLQSYMRWFANGSDVRPGMLSLAAGIVLLVLGLVIIVSDMRAVAQPAEVVGEEEAVEEVPDEKRLWLSLLIAMSAIVAFAVLVQPAGLLGAILVTCGLIAIMARFETLVGFLIFYGLLAAIVYAVFVLGLQLPIKVFP